VEDGAVKSWTQQETSFAVPVEVSSRKEKLTGRLRLLYQEWAPPHDFAGSSIMPISHETLLLITNSLNLPRCFPFDFASKKHVPTKLSKMKTPDGNVLGY